ncbi:MAG: T9SS type A sorting domain-containing protein [Melioribacteraceae bacterium]|nr:T9SS type A sorting domain-containing protein [Melioribacteraceae bacterium]MCF8354099.1 T9SS type A sorting domain-containing protein [Melioribacteraceae bacterium]MCF8393771.1 T9SS type A sorting domain-containing protein [Melioribacteraceae bacterium]MCF8419515.1 T9SS type A sorting domain-containing protein [Melioribacteraceae bacterium]
MKNTAILFFIMTLCVYSQTYYEEGNLVRIDFRQSEYSLSDTICKWYSSSNEHGYDIFRFIDAIDVNSQTLFIYEEHFQEDVMGWWNGTYFGVVNPSENEPEEMLFLPAWWDIFDVYDYSYPTKLKTESGILFMMGNVANSFISNNAEVFKIQYSDDSLGTLIYLAGKIDDKYLAVFSSDGGWDDYGFYLIDSLDFTDINPNNPQQVFFPEGVFPHHLEHISGNIFISDYAAYGGGLGIFIRDGLIFYLYENIFLTNIFPSMEYNWRYRNNYLYINYHPTVRRYEFNSLDSSFTNETILFDFNYDMVFDDDFKYAAFISNDSLFVFNTIVNDTISYYDISRITSPSRLIIDSPYVYIHQLKKVTVVKENDEAIVNEYSLSSYPNPFNAVTTITYSIPEAGQVEIKIYDVLGREVTTLKNEIEDAGKHKINWDANNTSSGIYICTMKTERKLMSTKLLLMK